MSNRTKAREQVIQVLYLMEQTKMDAVQAFSFFCDQFEVYAPEVPMIRSYVTGIAAHLDEIDAHIEGQSMHWKMNRIPKMDKCILRLGIFELMFMTEVPPSVVMDEAIELAKKFAEEKSPKFINGILDAVASKLKSL